MESKSCEFDSKRKYDKEKKQKILLTLFIANIFELLIAFIIFGILKSNFVHMFIFKYMWVYYLLIPVSLLSLILGVKFSKSGIKCKKNILIGILSSIIFFIAGLLSFDFDGRYKMDYKDALKYEDLLNAKLPSNGVFYKIKWDNNSNLENHSSNVILISENDFVLFHDSIKKEYYLKNDLDPFFVKFMPNALQCKSSYDACYYSIFVYGDINDITSELKPHVTYFMMYDINRHYIQIDEFTAYLKLNDDDTIYYSLKK